VGVSTADAHTAATPATSSDARIIDLDVTRAVALIGVCVMNYHGYLILRGAQPGDGFLARVFNPWVGPFSTRFAATFVTVAGMGVALLTRRAVATRESAEIHRVRWVLIRRGVLLYSFGFFLNWVWSGTILFYYGAYFLVAAAIFMLGNRWVIAIGASAAVAAAAIQWWSLDRTTDGHSVSWLLGGSAAANTSPRDLVLDTFVRGTHPLLPWLAFLCMGIVLGRSLPFHRTLRVQLAFVGVLCVAAGYLLRDNLPVHPTLRSTFPFDRGLLYTLTAIGSSLVAISVVGWLAEATAESRVTRMLAVTGRTTLSLYVLHVLVFNLLVDWLGWVQPAGLGTALAFALGYWVVAIALANVWHTKFELGPLEWVYRRFS
jgi:uncharacterized protein